jgi:hypothetical protein
VGSGEVQRLTNISRQKAPQLVVVFEIEIEMDVKTMMFSTIISSIRAPSARRTIRFSTSASAASKLVVPIELVSDTL